MAPDNQPGPSGPASSAPLPTGAATSALQTTGNASLVSMLTELQSILAKLNASIAVTAASLPLPTGASTAARQDTLLSELQLKADLTETQPVSLASVPLATNAAQETGGNLATTVTRLTSILAQLDVALSTRAAESGGNLAAIAGKDFATQTTLALIKAKTDNLDVTLSGGGTHVIVDTMPPVSANSSADVLETDGDAGYADGETGQNLTQTPDGRLRVTAAGLVSDVPESYVAGDLRSLSLTADGRLRVSSQDSLLDRVWQHTFNSPWPESGADGPSNPSRADETTVAFTNGAAYV